MIKKFIRTGLWLQPILFLGVLGWMFYYYPMYLSKDTISLIFLTSIIVALLVCARNLGKPNEEDALSGKEKAMWPSVNTKLLFKKPTGVVLGKYRNKYVCKPLDVDGHVILIGGSGSGKTSSNGIPTLEANEGVSKFVVDIKGEFSFKTVKSGDEKVLIFNPSSRDSYGYDPLYNLDKDSSNQKILETMQTISYSLIPMPADLKDPFWKLSSRNLLIGLLIYYYKKGIVDFVSIIDEILSVPIETSIEEAMNRAPKKSSEYRYLNQFSSMASETLGGIVAEMNNHLVIFSNDQDIRYSFKENGCKIDPHALEEGYSIYLSIREEKLSAYYDVMQIIINQTLAELEKRPEDSKPIIFLIDELPRILSAGKIDRLLDAARTLRSRKVCLFLITQSLEALMTAYTENEVTDLISNCSYVIVLSASSPKTQRAIVGWCGKYKARRQTWSGGGMDRKTNISYEEKDIIDSSELITLPNTGDAIIITPYGYNRIKKCPYYKDKILGPKSKEIVEYNKSVLRV